MIIDPDVFLGAILPNLSKWFNKSDVEYKRKDIANLIKEIASKDKIFPKINLPSREEASKSKDKNSAPKSVKIVPRSSKVEKLEAKIREDSIKNFKSDKLKSFDMFEASFKSFPVKKKPKLISDVQMVDKGAREESSNSRADPRFRGGLSLGLAGN